LSYAPEQGYTSVFFCGSMDAYGGHHNRRMLRKLATEKEKPGTGRKEENKTR
jgi:hypothetical protein